MQSHEEDLLHWCRLNPKTLKYSRRVVSQSVGSFPRDCCNAKCISKSALPIRSVEHYSEITRSGAVDTYHGLGKPCGVYAY